VKTHDEGKDEGDAHVDVSSANEAVVLNHTGTEISPEREERKESNEVNLRADRPFRLETLEDLNHGVRRAVGGVDAAGGDVEETGGRTHDEEGDDEGERGGDNGLEAALLVESTLLANVPAKREQSASHQGRGIRRREKRVTE
jgi:hypothetical protein